MNLRELSYTPFEQLTEKQINELIIESLFPSERKEYKYYNSRYPTFISNNDFHRLDIVNNNSIGNKKSNTYKPNNQGGLSYQQKVKNQQPY